ncbi:MAG: citramalate synthase [Eggerthellaceae bacterium]|nr:citramalate synthase [Eggerthellaceae bacterium]
MTNIETYDTTLRDGEQGLGITLSLEDKLRIVECLDHFGIDIIEGGYPTSNPKDIEFFKRVAQLPLTHARIAAFGSTCHKGSLARNDAGLQALIESGAPVITLVGKAHASQVQHALRTSLEENLRMITDSISFCVQEGREVIFDAEHFFDGYDADPEYALEVVRAAQEAGASRVCLCETNGGQLPASVSAVTTAVHKAFPDLMLGIHCHNDSGCAVANTLDAVGAGARQVQGTINGYGERAGNADLLNVIANLQLKMGYNCVPDLSQLSDVAHFVAESCNVTLPAQTPYTGKAAFAHKGGLHASAQARLEGAYEHVDPALVGNTSSWVVSELSGRASLVRKAESFGLSIEHDEALCQRILDDIKQREAEGYAYEVADGSLYLLMLRHLGKLKSHFTLESFRVIVDDREDTGSWAKDATSEATIKIRVGDVRTVATGEGTGPVEALDTALRMAIGESYPQVAAMELVDFKVRILDENVGTGAVTRVIITTSDGEGNWGTVGVSENIIEASWNALVDSIEYGLHRIGV